MAQQAITGGTATVLSFSGCAMPKSQGLAVVAVHPDFFFGVFNWSMCKKDSGDSARQLVFTVFSYILCRF